MKKQYKILNKSKGKSVWSPRAQVDKREYENYINKAIVNAKHITVVQGEVVNIEKELNKHLPNVDDTITKIKLTEAVKQLDNLTKGKIVKDKQVLTLMRYYELVKELRDVHEN